MSLHSCIVYIPILSQMKDNNALIRPLVSVGYFVKIKTYRRVKDADGKFCLGKRCQRQPSTSHI